MADLKLIPLSEVTPSLIAWLWPKRLAYGSITLLSGDGGLGKSFVTLDIAARISRGAAWPCDEGTAPLGEVVILSSEDPVDSVIVPRLIACNADLTKISALTTAETVDPRTGKKTYAQVDLETDVPKLDALLDTRPNCRLLIIDPITAYTGRVDTHRDAAVRGLLEPLQRLAQRRSLAVLIIAHLNKDNTKAALYRTGGSIAFPAAARCVLSVAPYGEQPDYNVLAPMKTNHSERPRGLLYTIDAESGGEYVMPRVVWGKESVEVDEDATLDSSGERGDAYAKAEMFIKDYLRADKFTSSPELRQAAMTAEVSMHQLTAALGVLNRTGEVVHRQGGPGKPHGWKKRGPEDI